MTYSGTPSISFYGTSTGFYTLTETNLSNGFYFWRIKVLNPNLPNLYSDVGVFEINPQITQITQIESEAAFPQVSALFQSFPNPAREGCWIPFQLAMDNEHLSISTNFHTEIDTLIYSSL